ncbi:bcl-2-interacting killer [Betta splendens]|uniref:Bcl-2-interacting killer n=1 Tax=Betta splendens TaxID=158456 RepID=A0A8M1HHP6_BETSP|nr:bcl-2-interacting killer [Betta splendens]
MVEQTRQQPRVISLQAGPGEVDTGTVRINGRAAQEVGRQLAIIGDQFNRRWSNNQPHWPPVLHLMRPAQALTRTIYRDIHSQLWSFQGLSAAVKAWIVSTTPGQGTLRAEAWTAWVSSCTGAACTGWTRGALVTVALVAAVSVVTTVWMEWKT